MPYSGMTAAMRHVLYDIKLRKLTMIPTKNAPNVPIMESYREDDKVILRSEGGFTVPNRW